jgi:hypothetical protein
MVWQNVSAAWRAAEQVRAGQVADQQRAARQQQGRLLGGGAIVDEQAEVLGGVAGGVQHLDADVAELDQLAVGDRPVLVAQLGVGRAEHLDLGAGAQLRQARQVVVVAVAVERVGDAQPLAPGGGEVRLDVPARIQDQRQQGGLVAQQVGRVAQRGQVELLEEHLTPPFPVVRPGC